MNPDQQLNDDRNNLEIESSEEAAFLDKLAPVDATDVSGGARDRSVTEGGVVDAGVIDADTRQDCAPGEEVIAVPEHIAIESAPDAGVAAAASEDTARNGAFPNGASPFDPTAGDHGTHDGAPLQSADAPAETQFRDFSCRPDDFHRLSAMLKRAMVPAELSDDDRRVLVGDSDAGADNEANIPLQPLAFIEGESGMGKSRLAAELRAWARRHGIRVQEVFCHERQGIPFLPILRIVKELLVQSSSRDRLWDSYGTVLGRVFPELQRELGECPDYIELSGEDGKIQLFDALAGILAELSRERPLLVVIHDIHRSDPGTVDFLEFLGRNVFLDDVAQQGGDRSEDPATEAKEHAAWKQIGNRERTPRDYITAGLMEGGLIDIDGPATRLMVVANYLSSGEGDPGEQENEVRVVERVRRLTQDSFAGQLQLQGLSDQETATLVREILGRPHIGDSYLSRIHQVTRGNPLHVVETCRYLVEEGALPPPLQEGGDLSSEIDPTRFESALDRQAPRAELAVEEVEESKPKKGKKAAAEIEGAPVPAPQQFIDFVISKRCQRLEPTQLAVARLLAMLRRPTQVQLLEQILEIPRDTIREALMQLETRAFVQVLPVERTPLYFLAHEDYTRCVYNQIDAEQRRELHYRIGQVLCEDPRAEEPVRAFEIYEHLKRSPSPRESVPHGLAAARYFAGAYALDAALRIECHLLGLMETDEDLAGRLELLSDLTRLQLRRGEPHDAKAYVKRYLEQATDISGEKRLEMMILLSDVYRACGEPLKGVKTLNRAQKRCADVVDPRTQGRICGLLAELRRDRKDTKRAINLCMRGLKEVEEIEGAETVRIELLRTLAAAHLSRHEVVPAIHNYQQLLEIVEGGGHEPVLSEVLSTLGRVYYDRGNYFRAARYLFRALDVVRRMQDVVALSRAYDALGKVYRNSGDHLRGLEYFNRSLRLRERIGDYEGLSPTLNSLGSLYAHMGNYYRAIRYFKRSVENSERFGDTAGIVRAFLHLSRTYYEIGELRQVGELNKQILILSQEFNLSELEGEGNRLQGNLLFLRGDWKGAERQFRKGLELVTKNGRKSGEAAANLDLGALLAEKEDYEAALKLISKGQLLAEEIQSTPLQARAYLLKGNVLRFLKGGDVERAREAFRRGLELVSGEHHLPYMWELDYSIAKVFQSTRQFVEAGESYRRADRILVRIASTLPEDMKVVYYDDRRRKVFYEDFRRFEKEASGRGAPSSTDIVPAAPPREDRAWQAPSRPLEEAAPSQQEVERILEAVTRVNVARTSQEWAERLLAEARRLVPSPSGFVFRWDSTRKQVTSLAVTDMGAFDEWGTADHTPGAVARWSAREGEPVRAGDARWNDLVEEVPHSQTYKNRTALVLPLTAHDQSLGAVYLERPSAQNPFTADEQHVLLRLLSAVIGQFAVLEQARDLRVVKGSGVLTVTAFERLLEDVGARVVEENTSVGLIEAQIPELDHYIDLIASEDGDGSRTRTLLDACLAAGGASLRGCVYLGDNSVGYLYTDVSSQQLDALRDDVKRALDEIVEGISRDRCEARVRSVAPDPNCAGIIDFVRTTMGAIRKGQQDFSIDSEIGRLTTGDLSLKEAKIALERRYITAELLKSRGNITRAAESLGVHRPQLSNLIKKHNVSREEFE